MKTVEIKKMALELSNDEKEILRQASDILYELYECDKSNNIFYSIFEEEKGFDSLSDFDDVATLLSSLCEKDTFLIKAD